MIMKSTARVWRSMSADERAPYEELATAEKERYDTVKKSQTIQKAEELTLPKLPIFAPTDNIAQICEEETKLVPRPTTSWTPINGPISQVGSISPSSSAKVDQAVQIVQGSALADQQKLIGISSTFFAMMETEKNDSAKYVYTVSILKLPLGVYREHQESPIHFYSRMSAANNYLRHLCERRLNLDDPRSCYAHGTNSDQGLWFERTDDNGCGYRIFAKKRCVETDSRKGRKVQKEWDDPQAKIKHQLK